MSDNTNRVEASGLELQVEERLQVEQGDEIDIHSDSSRKALNNIMPEHKDVAESVLMKDPVFAPYHRTVEEINSMPVIETTKTVCPECKLIIDGTIY
ncbi:MAG: hypothetical protein M1562_02450, partial [Candidatus Marsarchaeota archaeon]|nr:hypothetical protein [Candidatus Marsarchaeota archaeon]